MLKFIEKHITIQIELLDYVRQYVEFSSTKQDLIKKLELSSQSQMDRLLDLSVDPFSENSKFLFEKYKTFYWQQQINLSHLIGQNYLGKLPNIVGEEVALHEKFKSLAPKTKNTYDIRRNRFHPSQIKLFSYKNFPNRKRKREDSGMEGDLSQECKKSKIESSEGPKDQCMFDLKKMGYTQEEAIKIRLQKSCSTLLELYQSKTHGISYFSLAQLGFVASNRDGSSNLMAINNKEQMDKLFSFHFTTDQIVTMVSRVGGARILDAVASHFITLQIHFNPSQIVAIVTSGGDFDLLDLLACHLDKLLSRFSIDSILEIATNKEGKDIFDRIICQMQDAQLLTSFFRKEKSDEPFVPVDGLGYNQFPF